MTHGPAQGKGDLCSAGTRVGCPDLLEAIEQRATVAVHVAGHIHSGYGCFASDKEAGGAKLYVNASTCTGKYNPTNPPVVFDVPPVTKLRSAMQHLKSDGASGAEVGASHAASC